MKKSLLIILCLTALVFGINKRYIRPQINTVGLVAHWKLWAGLTTTASVFDYSLNANNGTVTAAVPAYPGFDFDGSTARINCASGSTIDNIFDGGGTLSLWLNIDTAGGANFGRVVDKAEWLLLMQGNATTLKFGVTFTPTVGDWRITIGSGWNHVLIPYNSDSNENNPIIYLNGVSASVSESSSPVGTRDTDAGSDFYIGNAAATDRGFDGKIDEVMLFNKILSAIEARSIYEQTRWRYGK